MKKLFKALVSILLIQTVGMPSSNADGNFPPGDASCYVTSLGVQCSADMVYAGATGATFPNAYLWYFSLWNSGEFTLVSSYGTKNLFGTTDGNGIGISYSDLLNLAGGNQNGVVYISVTTKWVGNYSSGGSLTILNPNGRGTYIQLSNLPQLMAKAKILEDEQAAASAAANKAAADKAAADKAKLDQTAQEATDAANAATSAANNAKDAADQAIDEANAATIAAQDAAAAAEAAGAMAVEAAEASGAIAQKALDAANAATDAALSAAEAADSATAAATKANEAADAVFGATNGLNSKLDVFIKSCQIQVSNANSIYQRMKVARGL